MRCPVILSAAKDLLSVLRYTKQKKGAAQNRSHPFDDGRWERRIAAPCVGDVYDRCFAMIRAR